VPELTIASCNIHWGRGPRGLGYAPFDVVEAAKVLDADVLVMQESWAPDDQPSDHQRVADALGMQVACDVTLARSVVQPRPKAVARPPGVAGTGGWHLVALARVEVTASEVVRLPHLWLDPVDRALLSFEVQVEGSSLAVVGTHLPHLEHGVWTSTRALRRSLPSADKPAVLLGDMNMWGWSISTMVPRGWRRAVRGKTWPAHRPHSQIDHILVTRPVAVASSEVGPDVGSDHLPVRARLRW
jgi:endonuclease/exonuclease/phosphatase family metal-dependent hydrolase